MAEYTNQQKLLVYKWLSGIVNLIPLDNRTPEKISQTTDKWRYYTYQKILLNKELIPCGINQQYVETLVNTFLKTCRLSRRASLDVFVHKIHLYIQNNYNDIYYNFKNSKTNCLIECTKMLEPKLGSAVSVYNLTSDDVRIIVDEGFKNIEKTIHITQISLGNGEVVELPFHVSSMYYFDRGDGVTKYDFYRQRYIEFQYRNYLIENRNDPRIKKMVENEDTNIQDRLCYDNIVRVVVPKIKEIFTIPATGSVHAVSKDIYEYLVKHPELCVNFQHHVDPYDATRVIINNITGCDHDGNTNDHDDNPFKQNITDCSSVNGYDDDDDDTVISHELTDFIGS